MTPDEADKGKTPTASQPAAPASAADTQETAGFGTPGSPAENVPKGHENDFA